MISRVVDLVGFAVCAGATGVWGLYDHQKLHSFLLFWGLVFFIHSRMRRHPEQKEDKAIKRIGDVFYAQGLRHGAARRSKETRADAQGDGQRLHKAS